MTTSLDLNAEKTIFTNTTELNRVEGRTANGDEESDCCVAMEQVG